jgi:hypothetical protein
LQQGLRDRLRGMQAMIPATVYAFVAVSLVLIYLVVTRRRIAKVWLLLWGLVPVLLVYLLNPGFRVYSFHSFMHGGIIYQILNGNVPPNDPVVAGFPVRYPWGPHLLAAWISKAVRVSPFYSLAAINIVSLWLSMVLAYKISRQLMADERANVLSAVGALFASTFFIPEVLKLLPGSVPTEIRGIPLIHKYITVNTLPVGAVLFLLTLYGAIRLFKDARPHGGMLLVFAAVAGTGFFYPAFLPGIAASTVLGFVVTMVARPGGFAGAAQRRAAACLAITIAAFLLLRPYLTLIGSGTLASLEILNWRSVWANVVRYLIAAGPVLAVVLIRFRALLLRSDRAGLAVLAVVTVATAGTYFAIHLPLDNEYKLLLLSSMTLGILAGPAFSLMLERYQRALVFILIALFLIPTFRVVHLRTARGRSIPGTYVERGIDLISTDEEDNEFYGWIRANTDPASVFIDSEMEVPVLGQRQILIPFAGRGRDQQKGYGMINVILRSQSGYASAMLERRQAVARKIYETHRALTDGDMAVLMDLPGDVFVVTRTTEAAAQLPPDRFRTVYSTSGGTHALHRLIKPEQLDEP